MLYVVEYAHWMNLGVAGAVHDELGDVEVVRLPEYPGGLEIETVPIRMEATYSARGVTWNTASVTVVGVPARARLGTHPVAYTWCDEELPRALARMPMAMREFVQRNDPTKRLRQA